MRNGRPMLYGDVEYFTQLAQFFTVIARQMRVHPTRESWTAIALDRGMPGDEKCHGVYDGKGPFK
jgi:hypothetical protein